MVCDYCDLSRKEGDRFCIYCGEPLFPQNKALESPVFIFGIIITLIVSALLLFELYVGIVKSEWVLSYLPGYHTEIFFIVPAIISVFRISGSALQLYYVLLLIGVTASLIYLFYKAIGPTRKLIGGDRDAMKDTALFEMATLFSALYLFELILTSVLKACGVNMTSLPERETWQWMFDLLEASVWEEIITRVLYLGVPVMIVYAITKKNELPLWRYLFGGFGMNTTALVFVVFSAAMFGAGHLTNWGLWKFIPTFAFGLIAGYLFVKYGVYATIAMHFLTDYLSAEAWLTGDSMVITALLLLVLMVLAIPYLLIYFKKGIVFLGNTMKNGERTPPKTN